MSKRCRKKECCKIEPCGCPTPKVCCSSMAVPTTAYQMVSVPQLVYDNVPASPYGMSPYGGGNVGGYGHDDGFSGGCGFGGSWIIIIILLLCFCGNGFGGGFNDGCGDGFGGSWIIIIILLLCFCGGGSGFGW